MFIDYSPRGSYKTTRLLMWLAEDSKRVLLTCGDKECKRLRELIKSESFLLQNPWAKEVNIMQIHRWGARLHGRKIKEAAIDNADILLQNRAPAKIKIITLTKED